MKTQESGISKFDFLFLIPGIATGMAIAKVLQFFGEILAYHPNESPALLHDVWLIALVIFILQHWFFILDWRAKEVIATFKQYLLSFLFPAGTYVMSVLLCPSHDEEVFGRLKNLLADRGHLIYLAAGLTMLIAAVEGEFIEKKAGLKFAYPGENFVRILFGFLFIVLGMIRCEWTQYAAVGLLVVAGIFRWLMAIWYVKPARNLTR
jgi:hypothetical protein